MKRFASCMALGLLFSSCVNQIGMDEVRVGTVPIHFAAKVGRLSTTTKVAGSAFESGDRVGLFAAVEDESLAADRYIDNLRLDCSGSSSLVPERDVFYPEGGVALDFVAYYPYDGGLAANSMEISVVVKSNQSLKEDRSVSDFLVATKAGVASSSDAVELSFKHKLTKIKIELLPGEEETADGLLDSDPRLVAVGFYTTGKYNLLDDTFSGLSDIRDITPYGEWKVSEGKLTGKELIVFPQQIADGVQFLTMEWDGTLFHCDLTETALTGNTQRVIQIRAVRTGNNVLSGVVGTVEDWAEETQQEEESSSSGVVTSIHTASLSFSSSHVYRVYQEGIAVAEICKEYLGGTAHAQAITIYPVVAGEPDLTQGRVLEVLNAPDEQIHGGTAAWDVESNTLSYVQGNSAPVRVCYIDAEGNIALVQPDTPARVMVKSYTLRDVRGDKTDTYPIVKVGTQYWMRVNLVATSYADGTPLALRSESREGAGYMRSSNGKMFFYNSGAVSGGDLAPEGWKIPSQSDWEDLQTYLEGDASLVKTGSWQPVDDELDEAAPVSNLSYLGIYPTGLWQDSHVFAYQAAAIWTLEDDGSIPESVPFLLGDDNAFSMGTVIGSSTGHSKGMSIRCLKE